MEVQPHEFLTSALDEGEWSVSCPGLFTAGERNSGTTVLKVSVGSRGKSLAPLKNRSRILGRSAPRLFTY
jgi:hypothetical protein